MRHHYYRGLSKLREFIQNGSAVAHERAREIPLERRIVYFHDIHLPYDYPPDWTSLYYNEQYMLAAYMLGGNRFQLLLPNAFVTRDAELHRILDPLWNAPTMAGLETHGASIWGTIAK